MQNSVTIPTPDDWHCHLRDGNYLATTVPHTAARFARAVVMPNLVPPVTSIDAATTYAARIRAQIPKTCEFTPLMTLYITDSTTPELIHQAALHPDIYACKLYPAGATTNSDTGVTDITARYPIFAAMAEANLPLLIHGEVTTASVDIFEREQVFIDQILKPIIKHFPTLRIVLEHITTKYAVEFVASQTNLIGATITAHHLYLNRNDLLVGGIKPDYYCLPILKSEADRIALIHAATSGNPKFFLGTDSAPHSQTNKYSACGCAGVYTAHAAIELVTQLFAESGKLANLAAFTSINGAEFYQLPINQTSMTLIQSPWEVPTHYQFGTNQVTPFFAGKIIQWQIKQ